MGARKGAHRYAGVRYDPRAAHGHVESYFLKANDPAGRRALWLKATIFASNRDPSRAVAETWAIAFDREAGHVATKSSVPFEAARFSRDDLDIDVDGSTLTRERWKGAVASGGRSVSFDLAVSGGGRPLVHFPMRWMYEAKVPSSKLVALVPDARADGSAVVNGERWDVRGWPMTIGHNWGTGHTPSYAWAHCNVWDPPGVVFEGFSARIGRPPFLSPASTLLFVAPDGAGGGGITGGGVAGGGVAGAPGGSGPRFIAHATFFGVGCAEGRMTLRRWKFRSSWRKTRIEGELWASTDDFVGLHYANPDGTMVYCLNSKLAQGELVLKTPDRGERLYRTRCAALEIATTDPHHGIRMYV